MLCWLSSMMGCAVAPNSEDSAQSNGAKYQDTNTVDSWSPSIEWTTHEAITEAEQTFSEAFPEPISILDTYETMMSMGDEACPGDETQLMTNLVPIDGCTSESGYFYSGVAAYIVNESEDDTHHFRGAHLDAGILLTDDNGAIFEGGGNIVYTIENEFEQDLTRWSGQVEGSWINGSGPLWLTTGISATLSVGGTLQSEQYKYNMNGAMSLMGVSMVFDQLQWDSSCGDHPTGSVGIRDPSGLWLWVELESDCSGCGNAVWDSQSDVQWVCMDLFSARQMLHQMAGSES